MSGDRILLVEDDKEIREGVEIFLKSQGYGVFQAADGLEGLEILKNQPIDLAIVDVMMPRMDGITMVARLRESFDFPVLFLSAKSEEVDKILGLNMGADDYMVKPFEMLELLARVEAVLRRTQKGGKDFTFYGVRIDFESRVIEKDGQAADCTPREYELLETLVKNRNIALSRERLLELVWGYDYEGDTRTVDVHIQKLRKKLGLEECIKTVYKLGYRLEIMK